jgi:hypothetical protein
VPIHRMAPQSFYMGQENSATEVKLGLGNCS